MFTLLYSNSSGKGAPEVSTAQGRRRGTPPGVLNTVVAASSVGPTEHAHRDERTRKGSDQRRRRPRDMRKDLTGDRAGGDPPRASRPKRAARGRGTPPPRPSASRNGNSDRRPHGQDSLVPGVGAPTNAEKDAEGATGARPKGMSRQMAPSRGSSGRGPGAGSSGPPPSSTVFLPTVEDDEEEKEELEDFPALPPASGRRTAPPAHPLPPPPREASAAGASLSLDYSSLAERLAAQAAAAAEVVKSAAPGNGTSQREDFLHLSVLPGFGDGLGHKVTRRGNDSSNSRFRECPDLQEAQETPAPTLSGSEKPAPGLPGAENGEVSGRTVLSLTQSPPRIPTLAASITGKRRVVGAAAATVALRARLRERWFRLEAVRKAQRQREASERACMAAEDDNPAGRRQGHQGGDDEEANCDVRGGRRQTRAQDVSDDCRSSYSSSDDSGGDGGGDGDGGSQGAGDIDTASVERSGAACVQTPRAISAAGIAAVRRSELAAAAASVHRSVSIKEDIVTRPQTTERAKNDEVTWSSASCHDKRSDTHSGVEDLDKYASGYGSSGSSGSGGASAPGERAHAACEAGMAGLLNDILVRSGGRAADGKDKVKAKTSEVGTVAFDSQPARTSPN